MGAVTLVVDAAGILEVLETKYPEFTERERQDAAEAIVSSLDSVCLYSLAEYLMEESDIEPEDFHAED